MPELDDEITIESRTQSPEEIQAALGDAGYKTTDSAQITDGADKPQEASTVVATPAVIVPAVVDTEVDDDEDETPVAHDPTGKRTSGIFRLKTKIVAKDEEIAELKRQLAADKPAQAEPTKVVEATKVDEPASDVAAPRPDADSFEDGQFDPKYLDAMLDWRDGEKDRVKRVTAQAEVVRQATERTATTQREFKERFDQSFVVAREQHADFDAVITAAGSMPLSRPMDYVMKQSTAGFGRLAYWLASNAAEATRIFESTNIQKDATEAQASLAVHRAWNELEKIEAQLQPVVVSDATTQAQAASETPKKIVPVKPQPPEPVGARSGTTRKRLSQLSSQELSALDTPEYLKLRKEEYGS